MRWPGWQAPFESTPPAAPAGAPPGTPAALFTVCTAPEAGRGGAGAGQGWVSQLPRVPRPSPRVLLLPGGEPGRVWSGTQ